MAQQSRSVEEKSLPTLFNELWELIVAYFKQESVEPLKDVGRFVAFGVAGAILIGLGLVLVGIGGLRLLENERSVRVHLSGNWSWVPYLGIAGVSLAVAGISVSRIFKVPSRKEP
jgi:hypothetical protein